MRKKFDTDYKKELKLKIKYIFEYLPIPEKFKKQDLIEKAIEAGLGAQSYFYWCSKRQANVRIKLKII